MSLTAGQTTVGRDPAPVLWGLTGLGWLVLVAMEFVPHGHLTHAAHAVMGLQAGISWPLVLVTFAGGWLVMTAAMMLPTTVPMARMFTIVSARQPSPHSVRHVFLGAYFTVWLGFALLALGPAVALRELTGGVRPDLVLAGTLALAGAFQFSPLKQRCLTICREPTAFLFAHYRQGPRGAWRLGLRHAMSCLGCCWALMLVMFATGVADLAWMLGLTAIMVAEKVTSWGRRLVVPVGIVLLATAAVFAFGDLGWLWASEMHQMHGHHH